MVLKNHMSSLCRRNLVMIILELQTTTFIGFRNFGKLVNGSQKLLEGFSTPTTLDKGCNLGNIWEKSGLQLLIQRHLATYILFGLLIIDYGLQIVALISCRKYIFSS